MTLNVRFKLVAVLGLGLLAAQASAEEAQQFKTDKSRTGYAIGVDLAKNIKRQGIEIETDDLLKGMRDGFSGGKTLMTEEEITATLNALQTELKQKKARAVKAVAEDNKKQGTAFLAENKTKEGVVTLTSGLQYKILKAGDGKKPSDGDKVECNYRGTLIDGTEFSNSYRMEKTATFELKGGIMPGWYEALKLMPAGSKWQLFIPPDLGYGENGAAPYVGPNATLIFEVELVAVK